MHGCNECNEIFCRKDELERHLLREHPSSDAEEPDAKRAKHDDEEEELESEDDTSSTENDVSETSDESSDSSDNEDDDLQASSGKKESLNIWEVVKECAEETDGNELDAYIGIVNTSRALKKDEVHRKIMDTMQRYRDGPDAMDFHEALSKAAHKRKHLIKQKTDKLEEEEDEQ